MHNPWKNVGALLVFGLFASAAAAPAYRLINKVTLGGAGGWDYIAVDPGTSRLFIPRGTHIQVVDSNGKLVDDISGVKGAHAIAFAPDLGKAFLSTDGSVSILDM